MLLEARTIRMHVVC